ncbi:MAG: urea ABC transporter permease subunit UrtB [Brevinematales bacterium]|nr:urea ABC transporter permease subunit UrtB [Brevinematales bacterium]
MNFDTFLMQIFNGLSISSILLLIAIGLSITFGIMGVINFAHGEFLMIGAYTVYLTEKILFNKLGENSFFVSIILAFIISGFIGFILEKLLIKHLYGKPYEAILVTWGLSLILQQLARNIFGASNVDVISPSILSGGIKINNYIQLPYNRIFIIIISIICIILLYIYIYKTSNGRKMRAVMQNRSMAACMGINTQKVDSLTFSLGCGLAGIAGAIVSLLGSIGPSTGQNYIIDSFMVVVLGGVGNLAGTVGGAIMMGVFNTFFEFVTTSSMGKVIVFSIVIIFLQFRPSGLFSVKTRSLD